MPTNDQIAVIKSTFAERYDLDLAAIRDDGEALKTAVEAAGAGRLNSKACFSYDDQAAFIQDLDTFDLSKAAPDSRLDAKHIETNLNEAMKLAQTCMQLRSYYGELARHRNETRFKGEEFVRLDDVHRMEVKAGLFSMPWREASDERQGLEAALTHATSQRRIPQDMLSGSVAQCRYSAVLTDAAIDQNAAKTAMITRSLANTSKDQVERIAVETTNYRSAIETATWQETLAGAEVTIAQLSAKISIAKRKEDYLKKDEEFRLHRAEISRHLAWIQIAEHCRTGSELNYDERLKSVKALFDANLKPLAERLLILEQGLRSLYGIDLPIGKPANGRLLDEAVVWLARASEEIAKWQRTQRLSLIAIPSQGTIKLTESGSFEATFAVDDQSMPAQDGLLRGVNLEFQGTGGGPIQAWLKPPAIVGAEGGLMFGRVCAVAPGLDLRPQQSEQVWNKDPRGEWKATGTAQPAFGIPSRLLLYLWVSSR